MLAHNPSVRVSCIMEEPSTDLLPDREAPNDGPSTLVLPERFARLVNPDVVATRSKIIAERASQRGMDSVYRRRYIEVLANHLLKTLNE
jgi:hypothetical protein